MCLSSKHYFIFCLMIHGVYSVFTPIPPVVFSPATYTFLVPEDSGIGTKIGRINPITQEDSLPTLAFSSIGTTMVSVSSNYDVELTEAAPDYENIPSDPTQFQIQIDYTFQSHSYALRTNITIYITDVNDNIPIFSLPSYSFSFTEDLPTLSLIGFVSAVDNDGDPYNCISYAITPPAVNISANISVTDEGAIYTGTIFVPGSYWYQVTATDSGVPPAVQSVALWLIVAPARVPSELTAPILQQTEFQFQLREDVSLHTDIGTVAANRDPSLNGTNAFLYSVPDSEALFQFDASTGVLSNRASGFDFESGVTNYTFPVVVKLSIEGSSAVQLKDTSPITVFLRNVNEHSPLVSMDTFYISVPADTADQSAVGKLPTVSDADGQTDFIYSIVTESPFRIDRAGFVYVNSTLDYSVSSYTLMYEVSDKPLIGVARTTSATLIIDVAQPSVPPEKSLPTRNVVYKHTCASPTSHSFALTWLPPTDNSNPTQYEVSISCFLSPSETITSAVTVTEPLAEVVISATFDRFTQCSYLVTPLPEGPAAGDTISDLSFNNLEAVEFSIRVTNQSLILVEISNITMCLNDLHGNTQLFDTSIILSDFLANQVAEFDASYTNYYDTQTRTLSLVGYLSSSSSSLISGTNYSLKIQFPVSINELAYPWYSHALIPIERRTDTLGWTQTCSPAFYTYTSLDTSLIDQSCSLVFIRAVTSNSFYQSLLPTSAPLSITIRDTIYGVAEWDTAQLVGVSLTQICNGEFTPLYWNQVVQQLFLISPVYTLSDTATPNTLSLIIDPVSICSLSLATNSIPELTTAFQSTHTVDMFVTNDTTSDQYSCDVLAPNLNQLIILSDTPNTQGTPAVQFNRMVANNLTLECDWLLTPGGVYSGIGVLTPLSSYRQNETITLVSFTFQIDPVDDNQVPRALLVPYGTNNGDILLAKGPDSISTEIDLTGYFLIGSLYTDKAFVSNKGVISFGNPFTSQYPEIFPGYSTLTRNAYIIAPFWANIDTTFLGEVSWQLHTDPTLLSQLSSLAVTHAGGVSGFSATIGLVVTWHKVRPFPAHGGVFYRCLLIGQNYMHACTQHNTFQAVVLSDGGVNTYALFAYNCEDFHWSSSPFDAAIGFNAGGTFYNNHFLSTTSDVNLVPCANSGSSLYPQTVVGYRISSTPGALPVKTQAEMCRDRITADVTHSSIPAGQVLPPQFLLRKCPIDSTSAKIDFRFLIHSTEPLCFTPLFPASDSQSILCCYSLATGTFLSHLSTFLRYSPLAVAQYATYEDGFFDICCVSRLTCDEYYNVRPLVPLDTPNSVAYSGGYGDPHFTTFDGFEYTFNGIGEYVLTNSIGLFEAQIRTSQLDTISATFTSAIVLKSYTSDLLHFEISGTAINTYKNGRQIISTVPNFPQFHSGVGYKLSLKSTNQIIAVFSSGVTINVSLKSGVLNYAISLPVSYRDTLTGLLGNWNGNSSDDHRDPSGAFVDLATLTPYGREVALDTFGKSWAVTAMSSLFEYASGDTTATYSDTNFIPVFYNNLTATINATIVCGSSVPCLYDYIVAGDTIATNTLSAQSQLAYLQGVSSGLPPILQLKNGTKELVVRIGEWYYFLFEVFDSNGVFSSGVSSSLSTIELVLFNNLTEFRKFYVLKFRVAEGERDLVFGVTVWARSGTMLVSGFSFILSVCDCNFGVCSSSSLTQEDYTISYAKLTCVCNPGYTGITCDEDLNACGALQCYPEVSCVDLPPPSQVAECATCPSGTGGDGRVCEDFNECVGDRGYTHNCSGQEFCRNLIGGFECSCIAGYERNTAGLCVDVDECQNPICHQTCVNTPGSYHCDCVVGMSLSSDTFTCEPDVSCVSSRCDTESQICAMIGSNEICFCKTGFVPNEIDSFSCLDLNECQSSICDQACTNQIGGYLCGCENGYSLFSDGRTCRDINECVTPNTCDNTFICSNLIGSYKCINPLNPFPLNSSIPQFSLDVPGIVAGSLFAGIVSLLILAIVLYFCYKDIWRSWRRRGGKESSNDSEIESGTNFNIFKNKY